MCGGAPDQSFVHKPTSLISDWGVHEGREKSLNLLEKVGRSVWVGTKGFMKLPSLKGEKIFRGK